MAQVKKKNPIIIMLIVLMVLVVAIFATQLFWPARLDENGKLTRFGGGSTDSGSNSSGDGATLNTNDEPQVLANGDNPNTKFIE